MQFKECPDITQAKMADLRARIARLGISLAEIQEQFVRGSGKGGQKINKTSNCVQLKYPRFGMLVRCQRERRRSLNRFLALRELVDRVELLVSPQTSRRRQEWDKLRRRKARRAHKEADAVVDGDGRQEFGQDGASGEAGGRD